jgi:hypothetical protein
MCIHSATVMVPRSQRLETYDAPPCHFVVWPMSRISSLEEFRNPDAPRNQLLRADSFRRPRIGNTIEVRPISSGRTKTIERSVATWSACSPAIRSRLSKPAFCRRRRRLRVGRVPHWPALQFPEPPSNPTSTAAHFGIQIKRSPPPRVRLKPGPRKRSFEGRETEPRSIGFTGLHKNPRAVCSLASWTVLQSHPAAAIF